MPKELHAQRGRTSGPELSTHHAMIDLTRRMENALVGSLRLDPVSLPPDLAGAVGSWQGAHAQIETHAYSGGAVRYARVACVTAAHLQIGNVLAFPHPTHALPILGADLVAISAERAMIAIDLSPTEEPGERREAQLAPLASRLRERPTLPPGGTLPEWCRRWFSPHALFTRGSLAELGAAQPAVLDFVEEFVRLARTAIPCPHAVERTSSVIHGYMRDHRTDDRGLNLLAAMFGRAWMDRYIDEVLFPTVPPV